MASKANRLALTATVSDKQPLRYSPAGVPILNCRLAHESEQMEAGAPRTVRCEIPAMAVGEVAMRLARCDVGREARFEGFLATGRRYEIATLHVTEFSETPAPHATARHRQIGE